MQNDQPELSHSLNSLENSIRMLDDVLDAVQRQQETIREQFSSVLETVDQVRAAAAAERKRAERLWETLLDVAEDLARYKIVGTSENVGTEPNTIIQVLAVGLLHGDGTIARLAKVLLTN